MSEEFGKTFWEDRYRSHTAGCGRQPNPQLVTEARDLASGTALDAGCGEGADAIWLAARGWWVTAVDIAATALRRAREHADTLGADVASRIDCVHGDLTSWTHPEEHFDLVSTHYVHPAASRDALFCRLAASVAPGGTLLIVGHHPSDSQTTTSHTSHHRCTSPPRRPRPASTPAGGTSPSRRPGPDRPPPPTATRSPCATPSSEPANVHEMTRPPPSARAREETSAPPRRRAWPLR